MVSPETLETQVRQDHWEFLESSEVREPLVLQVTPDLQVFLDRLVREVLLVLQDPQDPLVFQDQQVHLDSQDLAVLLEIRDQLVIRDR